MNDIKIRKAVPADIPTLIGFQQKLALETENKHLDPTTLETGLHALFNDPSKGYYTIATLNNEPIACYLITYEWSDWRNGWAYWLQSVFVDERYRKQGVFKLMFDDLLSTIRKESSVVGLRLYVDKSNLRAQNVYKAMGMDGDHYTVYEWMKS